MFLSCCSPISSNAVSSFPKASSWTLPDTQIPPGLARFLQARCYVDPIPKDVAPLNDYVTLVDANSKLDAFVLGYLGITRSHPALNLHRTTQSVHYAREFHENAVPGGLHDPASVLGDRGVHESPAVRFEFDKRALLVGAHEPAVTGHIGC